VPLLAPLAVGPLTVRNRVMFGPHETNLGRRRAFSERHVAYYRRRAGGGAGLIVTEEASVHPSDWPYERAPLATDAGPGWAAVAEACHAEGAAVVAAVGHAGGQGSSAYSQLPLWAPSRVPEVNSREVPKWMEADDIRAVVAGFAEATRIAVGAGVDGVEVNAGQHSLIRQFLSGLTNQREDEWGGDRLRFATDVLTAVRAAVGGAVVGLRLCCDELAPWAGITPEAAAGVARTLAPLVDYVVVVRGSIYTVSATRPDGHTPAGFNRELTSAVHGAVAGTVPVYWQGSVVDAADAEAGLAAGDCDGVEMTRAQIADPDLVAKLARGASERIRPCILCNQTCLVRDNRNPMVTCVVEPSAGHETEDAPVAGDEPAGASVPTGRERERHPVLLVVGAGPAGLECARVAAQGGRAVTVADRQDTPGGLLRVAATAAGRERLGAFTAWLEAECRRLGVTFDMRRAISPDDVGDHIGDHGGDVVLCTGSRAGRRTYEIDGEATVLDAAELLEVTMRTGADGRLLYDDRDLPPGPVLVWDPIGGPIGISVAETLAAVGRPVTLATPDNVVGTQLSRTGDLAPANVRLLAAGVELVKRVHLLSVGPGRVSVVDRFSAERSTIDATLVVDAGPLLPGDRLWRATGATVARAGDAVAPRTVYDAVLEGRRAAQALLNGRVRPARSTVGATGGTG
jgi:mycofactocin system FadH/OYE family oxidoreductase 1